MPIRLSGINSGLDTDALVKELVSAYSLKTEKYEKQKTKVEWKKDAWQGLNTKIYGLYTSISNLRYDSAYNLKRTTVSDSTKAKITASSSAVTGTQKLEIVDMAQASYITGKKLDEDVTSKTTLADLGYKGADTKIEVRTKGGDIKELTITKDTKISEIVSQMKDAGLNASFDEINGRFFISAKETGAANDFDLCATDTNSQDALKALGLNMSLIEEVDGKKVFSSAAAAYEEAYDLYNAAEEKGQDIETYLKELLNTYNEEIADQEQIIEDNKTIIDNYKKLQAQRDARKAYDDLFEKMDEEGLGLNSQQVYDIAKKLYSGGVISQSDVRDYLKDNNIELSKEEHLEKLTEILNTNKDDVRLVAKYDGNLLEEDIESITKKLDDGRDEYDAAVTATDEANAIIAEVKASDYATLRDLDNEEALNAEIAKIKVRADQAAAMMENPTVTENAAIKIKGQDAKIILNDAEFTSASNSFSINGLTIEASGETQGEISITTAVDTQGIYDKIKDFLTQYNSVINEITKLYNADAAKGYEPLTDEERDAMSETEIEKWEGKIKSSILRRDTSLGSIMNAMVNAMSRTYEVNGKTLSLGNFGISTLGFLNAAENEQYAYHIDGDEDDTNTSGKTDKLMKAIQEDPDQIIGFMKELTSGLYNAVHEKMKSTELSSVYKVYNDKEIDKEIKSIEDLIKKWQEKVEAEEDRYYKQFSQMEVALSKLQSQTNSLAGLLGQ